MDPEGSPNGHPKADLDDLRQTLNLLELVDTRVLVDEKNNTVKIIIFDSQESRQNRVRKKKQILNIQEFRPGRSAMQGHCGLRLFLKVTVQYSASW